MNVELVFLLEEESCKALLTSLLPRLLSEDILSYCRFIVFEGKSDLEKQLERKIRGYLNPQARFIVIRDQDSADCIAIKAGLKEKCNRAGKPEALIRIACRAMESWFLADLQAVEKALHISGLADKQTNRKFREPDYLGSPDRELEKLTNGEYAKVSGSAAIGRYLALDNQRSHSFHVLVSGIRRVAQGAIGYAG